MEHPLAIILFLFAEIILFHFCYHLGWLALKALSLGKLRVEGKRKSWKEARRAGMDYHFSYWQTSIFGLLICALLLAMLLA